MKYTILLLFSFRLLLASEPHLPVEEWKEPIIYHYDLKDPFQNIELSTNVHSPSKLMEEVPSPNKHYGYLRFNLPIEKKKDYIYIKTKKGYPHQITLKNLYPNFWYRCKWVNERLLYISAWHGRIVGSNYLINVETMKLIHAEGFQTGDMLLQQYKESKKKHPSVRD